MLFRSYVIEKENSSLRGVLPKDFARASLDKRSLGELVDLLSELEIGNDKNKDTLGSVYEYFLGKFARAEGKLGGEFYTPRSVVELIVAMIEPHDGQFMTLAVVLAVCLSRVNVL